jgi:FeS assembly SUF system regulator
MMRMSKLADYSTVVMTYMARKPDALHSAHEVAEGVGLALPTVSKIFKILARGRLVVSTRGVKGGYLLARAPEKISIAEIIDTVEGRIALTECSHTAGLCLQESHCSVRGNWQKINHAVRGALAGVSLAEMSRPVMRKVEVAPLTRAVTRAAA